MEFQSKHINSADTAEQSQALYRQEVIKRKCAESELHKARSEIEEAQKRIEELDRELVHAKVKIGRAKDALA